MSEQRDEPERTCAGCRRRLAHRDLVRLACVPEAPYLVPDARRRLGGRGVWIEPRRECLRQAAQKGGFARAMAKPLRDAKAAGTPIPPPRVDPEALAEVLLEQLGRRLRGLAHGGRRAQHVCLGTEAVRESLRRRATRLLWVAEDAAGRRDDLVAMTGRVGGRIQVFGTKSEIGDLFERDALSVVSIDDDGLAKAMSQVISHIAGLQLPNGVPHKDPAAGSSQESQERE